MRVAYARVVRIPGKLSARFGSGLTILYEDEDILVVDKPAGLLTIATARERSRTAYFILTDYVRKGSPRSRNRIFIVHRLDRETSGVLVFAKNADAKLKLQSQWRDRETEKKYLAVVHGVVKPETGTIATYLAENRAHIVYSTNDPAKGKLSRTVYTRLKSAGDLSLLEVQPLTGRKHQIRVHLAGIGHPIVGDAKYGLMADRGPKLAGEGPKACRDGVAGRLGLHARSLSFVHPSTGKRVTFEAKVPAAFSKLFGGR